MEKIPTAEEILREYNTHSQESDWRTIVAMKEFAKLHVEQALKAAADNAEIQEYDGPVHLVTPIVNESSAILLLKLFC